MNVENGIYDDRLLRNIPSNPYYYARNRHPFLATKHLTTGTKVKKLLTQTRETTLHNWISQLREFQLDSYFENRILGRAYEYTSKVTLETKRDNQMELAVEGTARYLVTLSLEDQDVYGDCSCPYEGHCKHIAAAILSSMQNDSDR